MSDINKHSQNEPNIDLHLIRVINHTISTSIGIPLSCLVFFLIFKQSPEHFKSYTKILIMSSLVDTYFLIETYSLQASMTTIDGQARISFYGPVASAFGYPAYCSFLFLQNIGPQIAVAILPVQFGYRYFTVKKNRPPTLLQTIFAFCFISSISLIPMYSLMNTFCPANKDSNSNEYHSMRVNETTPMLYGSQASTGFFGQFSASITLVIFYLIALCFLFLTMKELNKRFKSLSYNENVKFVQSQLSKTLLIQCTIPLFTMIIPRFIFVFANFSGMSTKRNADFFNMINVWFPVLNLISIIVCIVPYRKYCLKCFKCACYQKRISSRNDPTMFNFQTSVHPPTNYSIPRSPISSSTPIRIV